MRDLVRYPVTHQEKLDFIERLLKEYLANFQNHGIGMTGAILMAIQDDLKQAGGGDAGGH